MKMFAPLDKTKPNTGNIRGLNWAAVKRTTVQVSRLALYYNIGQLIHDLLMETLYVCCTRSDSKVMRLIFFLLYW